MKVRLKATNQKAQLTFLETTSDSSASVDVIMITPAKSLKIRNHASEFNWGYSGSGPAQLSLAICLELFGPTRAQKVYQDFKRSFIAPQKQTDTLDVELDLMWNDFYLDAIGRHMKDTDVGTTLEYMIDHSVSLRAALAKLNDPELSELFDMLHEDLVALGDEFRANHILITG